MTVVVGGRTTTMKTGTNMQLNEEDEDHSEDGGEGIGIVLCL